MMPPVEEQVEEVEVVEETSMRDDVLAAMAEVEEPEGEPATNEEEETAEAQAAPETSEGEVSEQAAVASDADDTSTIGDGNEDLKAPVGWTPAAREHWAEMPDAVKQQVSKREGEIATALESGKEQRKLGERFGSVSEQFASVLAAEGAADPVVGVQELMKVVATLQSGSPQQKAEKIAGFIKHYGVPIETLDGILAGDPGAPTNDPMRQMIDDRLKPVDNLLQRMDKAERERNYNANQKAVTEVTQFRDTNEFYNDVQNDMADMVEMAEKRGIEMPLQEAYNKACALHPEVSKVLADRAESARIMGSNQTIADKRNAASSVVGKQGGTTGVAANASLRDTLADAWDSQVG
jgi:hypothetical protein